MQTGVQSFVNDFYEKCVWEYNRNISSFPAARQQLWWQLLGHQDNHWLDYKMKQSTDDAIPPSTNVSRWLYISRRHLSSGADPSVLPVVAIRIDRNTNRSFSWAEITYTNHDLGVYQGGQGCWVYSDVQWFVFKHLEHGQLFMIGNINK